MTHVLRSLSATVLSLTLSSPLAAQTVLSGDHSIDGSLCAGSSCTGSETFGTFDTLKLKRAAVGILFDDTSGTSTNDWRIQVNDTNEDSFYVSDVTGGTRPFKIIGTAPDNALFVAANGNIGIGTSLPQVPLHVETSSNKGIRLTRSIVPYGPSPQDWSMVIGDGGEFAFRAGTGGEKFFITPDAPAFAFAIGKDSAIINRLGTNYDFQVRSQVSGEPLLFADAGTSHVGIGTDTPETGLHVTSGAGNGALLIEETSPGTLGQLHLKNNGITFFTLEDTSIAAGDNTGRAWNFQNQAGTFRVTTAPGGPGEIEMLMEPDGDMHIKGQLYTGTGGATTECVLGCDRVFDEGYPLPSIAEHAAEMHAGGHLPAVGPTPEGGPFNLSQMTGGMLNELEKAHLYIAELDARNARLEIELAAQTAENAAQNSRLAALEALLAAMQPAARP